MPKLRHLSENGYGTITTREYSDWLAGRWSPVRPTVMLTFDDGLRAFAQRTLPLLERFKMRCVLFVCPGLVSLASAPSDEVSHLAAKTILSWQDLRRLHEDALVDIQSHGMWHNQVACRGCPVCS